MSKDHALTSLTILILWYFRTQAARTLFNYAFRNKKNRSKVWRTQTASQSVDLKFGGIFCTSGTELQNASCNPGIWSKRLLLIKKLPCLSTLEDQYRSD
jgi:hypothetical protein